MLTRSVCGAAVALAMAGPAAATDLRLPLKAPPVVAPPAAPWTGFYLGAQGGYAWGDKTASFSGNDVNFAALLNGTAFQGGTPLPGTRWTDRGGFGGLEGGYNHQFSPSFVLGVEADISAADIKGSASATSFIENFTSTQLITTTTTEPGTSKYKCLPAPPQTQTTVQAIATLHQAMQTVATSQKIDWFSTIRPRLGWLATPSLMLYGTAGLAIAQVDESVSYAASVAGAFSLGGFSIACPVAGATCAGGASSRTAVGWTAGVGAEYMVGQSFSVKAEYLYVGLPGDTVRVTASSALAGTAPSSFNARVSDADFQLVRVGLNYHF